MRTSTQCTMLMDSIVKVVQSYSSTRMIMKSYTVGVISLVTDIKAPLYSLQPLFFSQRYSPRYGYKGISLFSSAPLLRIC